MLTLVFWVFCLRLSFFMLCFCSVYWVFFSVFLGFFSQSSLPFAGSAFFPPFLSVFPQFFFSFSSPSVFLFFVSVRALPVFLFSGLCFWLSLSVFLFSPLLLFYPLLSPARGCLCPAFIRPPVVVKAGLLNAL